jgi:hypothetical protein
MVEIKEIYLYDSMTKEYKQSQIIQKIRNVFPMPINATDIKPDLNLLQPNQTYVFNESLNQWEIVPDFRNTILYHKQTKEKFIITEINKTISDYPDYTEQNPSSLDNRLDLIYFDDLNQTWDYDLIKCIEYIKQNINIIREEKINEPISYNNVLYDAGKKDIENVLKAIDGLQINNQNQIIWRAYDDSYITLTLTDLQNIYNIWLLRKHKVYRASFVLKDSLTSKTKQDIVNLLDKDNLKIEFDNIYNSL